MPAMLALVFVDPQLHRANDTLSEAGHNQRDVPWRGDHRVFAIKRALARCASVGVDICYDAQSGFAA